MTELQIEIIELIKKHNGITQRKIAEKLGETQQKISYNLKILEQAKQLVSIKRKGVKLYYPFQDILDIIKKRKET